MSFQYKDNSGLIRRVFQDAGEAVPNRIARLYAYKRDAVKIFPVRLNDKYGRVVADASYRAANKDVACHSATVEDAAGESAAAGMMALRYS